MTFPEIHIMLPLLCSPSLSEIGSLCAGKIIILTISTNTIFVPNGDTGRGRQRNTLGLKPFSVQKLNLSNEPIFSQNCYFVHVGIHQVRYWSLTNTKRVQCL